MAKRTLETTRTPDGRALVTDTRARTDAHGRDPFHSLHIDLGTHGAVLGAGDNLEDLAGSLSDCVRRLLGEPTSTEPHAPAYDVTVTLRSGHQISVPEWEDFDASAFADILRGFGDELIFLGTAATTKPLVRANEIVAVHAEPSNGIRSIQLDDGTYVWGCLGCGELGKDPSEFPGTVTMTGAFTHRCKAGDRV